jgi:hypothetical protein
MGMTMVAELWQRSCVYGPEVLRTWPREATDLYIIKKADSDGCVSHLRQNRRIFEHGIPALERVGLNGFP